MRSAFSVLALCVLCGSATACQAIVQTTLAFADGSSELDRTQVIKLAEWIDHATAQFPKYKDAYVEAGASANTSVAAARLAKRRAAATVRAFETLLPFGVPVETTSRGYLEKRVALDGGSDYATIQINPDFGSLNVPNCTPAAANPTP